MVPRLQHMESLRLTTSSLEGVNEIITPPNVLSLCFPLLWTLHHNGQTMPLVTIGKDLFSLFQLIVRSFVPWVESCPIYSQHHNQYLKNIVEIIPNVNINLLSWNSCCPFSLLWSSVEHKDCLEFSISALLYLNGSADYINASNQKEKFYQLQTR